MSPTAREVQIRASYGWNGAVTRDRSKATAAGEQRVCVTPDSAKACGPPCCRVQAKFGSGGSGAWITVAGGVGKNERWNASRSITRKVRDPDRVAGWSRQVRTSEFADARWPTKAVSSEN